MSFFPTDVFQLPPENFDPFYSIDGTTYHSDMCGQYGALDGWHWEFDGSDTYCSNCGRVGSFNSNFYSGTTSFVAQKPPRKTHMDRETRKMFKDAGYLVTKDGCVVVKGGCSTGTTGRYRPAFHYNERISQWCMADPKIRPEDWQGIHHFAETGEYGPAAEFTRATVIRILKRTGLTKYRDRWKSILHHLSPELELTFPSSDILEYMSEKFEMFLRQFYILKDTMPLSLSKGRDGVLKPRERHNVISYNYICRKILETLGIYEWHSEFPVPISHQKLIALDNITEKIMKILQLPFARSAVIKRPKFRRNRAQKRIDKEEKEERRTIKHLIREMCADQEIMEEDVVEKLTEEEIKKEVERKKEAREYISFCVENGLLDEPINSYTSNDISNIGTQTIHPDGDGIGDGDEYKMEFD